MNNEKRVSTRTVAVTGMMLAVTLILMFTPLGLIPLPVVSLTTMQIPVVITALAVGPVEGLIVGAGFGIATLIRAYTAPSGVLDPYFMNPLVSVLPRALIGLVAYGLYRLIAGKSPSRGRRIVAEGVGAAAGSLTNTLGVLAMLVLLNGSDMNAMAADAGQALLAFVSIPFGLGGLGEAAVSVLISIPVVEGLRKVFGWKA